MYEQTFGGGFLCGGSHTHTHTFRTRTKNSSPTRKKKKKRGGRSQSRIKLFQFVPYVTHTAVCHYHHNRRICVHHHRRAAHTKKKRYLANLCILRALDFSIHMRRRNDVDMNDTTVYTKHIRNMVGRWCSFI